jgi:hypothetical protein
MLSKGFWNHPGLTIMVNASEVLSSESRSLGLVSSLAEWDLFIKRLIQQWKGALGLNARIILLC